MRTPRRHPTAQRLERWQGIAVAIVLLLALAISVALIVFQPGTRVFPAEPIGVATDAPVYPPGTRYYYRRGQWLPYDQQEAPQP